MCWRDNLRIIYRNRNYLHSSIRYICRLRSDLQEINNLFKNSALLIFVPRSSTMLIRVVWKKHWIFISVQPFVLIGYTYSQYLRFPLLRKKEYNDVVIFLFTHGKHKFWINKEMKALNFVISWWNFFFQQVYYHWILSYYSSNIYLVFFFEQKES